MKTRSDKRLPFPLDERRVDVCLSLIHVKPGCWTWMGSLDRRGYGVFWQNGYPAWRAHRAVWVLFEGPIPDGLTLDHLCRNPACVRPSHLEPVTQAENQRRAGAARRAATTACPQGHPYDEANTQYRNGGRHRICAACNRARARAHQEARRREEREAA